MFGTTTMASPMVAAPAYSAAPVTSYATGTTAYAAAAPTMTTVAAPAYSAAPYSAAPMTSYAAPAAAATYAAAPTMTTVAAPAFIAAPTTQVASYVAPPAYTMAAPAVTQTASFVAPPAMMPAPFAMPAGIAPPAPPAMPVRLTEGLPTPEQILAQKNGYGKALDQQLKAAADTVAKETEIEKQMVKFTAEKNVALYNMQVDEALVEQLALADEQATVAHCELRKALVERNLQLNSQAQNMVMDYQMKALVTECEAKKYAFAQQYVKEESKLAGQFMQQEMKAHTGTAYGAPAPAVPVR